METPGIPWTELVPATPITPEIPGIPWTELVPATPIAPESPGSPWTELVPATPITPESSGIPWTELVPATQVVTESRNTETIESSSGGTSDKPKITSNETTKEEAKKVDNAISKAPNIQDYKLQINSPNTGDNTDDFGYGLFGAASMLAIILILKRQLNNIEK